MEFVVKLAVLTNIFFKDDDFNLKLLLSGIILFKRLFQKKRRKKS